MKQHSNGIPKDGLVLLGFTLIALFWSNSAWHLSYSALFHLEIFDHTVHHWINDGLMVLFFFYVGLEIKKELVLGELSDRRRATLPIVAALGGMVVPATIYFLFNRNGTPQSGWRIPMATDIAFAVGVLALFSRRVPFALKIFLLALAIADDLGAVLVIALFYTHKISGLALLLAALGLLAVFVLQKMKVRAFWVYGLMGLFVWYQVLQSGVHATVAGVLLGLMTPARPTNGESTSPLDQLVAHLHGLIAFVVMPIFALANAGVQLTGAHDEDILSHPITLGVLVGLLIGKPVGVLVFSWISIKMNWASLPKGVTWPQMLAAGLLAGIGFTMSLFISSLALKNPELETFSKSGILLGSLLSAMAGAIILARLPKIKVLN